MKKLLMVGAISVLALAACSEKEEVVVDEVEAVDVVTDEGVADEVETDAPAQDTPVIEEKENTLVVTVNGEAKEVEAETSLLGAEEGFSIKRVAELPVKEREEGDFLFAEEGELKGTSFVVYETSMENTIAKASATQEAMQYGAEEFPEEMNLEDYPSLQGKYDFYMQSIRSDFNRYAFAKDDEERGKVLTVVAEIPVDIATEETVALIEAMAASVKVIE